jgi:predicted RNA-binding Zn-ribbon protein involved in translation (DUF1610 family)
MSGNDDFTSLHDPESTEAVECTDCGWEGVEGDVKPIKNLAERVSPGEICPVGECPACGWLVHYKDELDD